MWEFHVVLCQTWWTEWLLHFWNVGWLKRCQFLRLWGITQHISPFLFLFFFICKTINQLNRNITGRLSENEKIVCAAPVQVRHLSHTEKPEEVFSFLRRRGKKAGDLQASQEKYRLQTVAQSKNQPPLCILPSCSHSWRKSHLTSGYWQDQQAPGWICS